MINRLHIVREKEFLKQKIAELNKLARRLRTTQNCNADYENYKELEAKIAGLKRILDSLELRKNSGKNIAEI